MSMQWDPLLTAALARELDGRLRGARVRSLLLDRGSRRLILFLRDRTLAAELASGEGWISLMPPWEPPPGAISCPYSVGSVRAPPDESILILGLGRGRRGRRPREIILELIGNRRNALVVEREGGTIRHLLVARRGAARPLKVGMAYRPPARRERAGTDGRLGAGEWRELIPPPAGGPEARAAILRRVAWTSRMNVDALTGPGGWERWKEMVAPASWGGFLAGRAGERFPYPVALLPAGSVRAGAAGAVAGTAAVERPTLLDAIREARETEGTAAPVEVLALPPGLLAHARQRLGRARRRVASLRRQARAAPDPARARQTGNLLLARLSGLPPRARQVTVEDFAGGRLTIDLDPGLTVAENAERFFREAARAERAQAALPGLIREAEDEATRWRRVTDRLRKGEIDPALAGVHSRQAAPGKDLREAGGGTLPYRRFRSSGGLEIRVGRGARANDDLTFRHSRPGDIWMHVRQSPGAHVILRWQGEGRPPRRDLLEAAALAALHSGARHAGTAAVSWTRRKYVRKPRGSPPGRVATERTETVFVTPDPAILTRLAAPS
ncbi:MAG: NFACT RNA binding domain-containing protein [Gammaproteobacteria bacterium]|nr:NFACT RNA binding domain-containing protein [Gammaproteobacteria bacterium]MDE0246411.1 NFACT RNA binding domain-containing protein [Gammaproteobacteria bacterium]